MMKITIILTTLLLLALIIPSTQAADGDEIWNHTATAYCIYGTSIGLDGTIYFGDRTGGSTSALHAFYPNGTEKWSYSGSIINIYNTPLSYNNVIYTSADENVYAINEDGTFKWSYYTGWWDYSFYGSPGISKDGVVYFTTSISMWALYLDGTLDWSGVDIMSMSTPAIDTNGVIYGVSGGSGSVLRAIWPNGTQKWSYSIPNAWTSPAIDNNGIIYILKHLIVH